ncbi:hypothetical protein HGRIS_009124 [Hohenbuehelia grisea]|uniref:Uncharacterized protein n=1 Tax=Hohenbuehelia grisea TaxID=104357 RepID=A0ABR3J0A7_9AGAR
MKHQEARMPPSIPMLFGPMLLGVMLNTALFGIMVVQALIYYQTYKRDAAWIRYFILYLFIVETANTILNITLIYEPLVTRFGKPEATTFFPTTLAAGE